MVFSSHVPFYLDPPNLQQHHQQGNGSENPHHQQLSRPLPPPHVGPGGGPGLGSVRPSSMADQARLAKIQHPEAALKCPRCESSNTKFCYFNNYSLSQPRYFCKTCRRYWTKGGALRNVPVGGGCRKNKKNKIGSSQSSSEKQAANNSRNSSGVTVLPTENEITGHLPQQSPHLPFMGSLQNLSQFGLGNLGLNFGGIQGGHIGETSGTNRQAADHMGFQIGTHQPHNLQLPFFDPTSNGLYPFQSEGVEGSSSSMVGESQLLRSMSPCSRVSQLAPVKMENNKSRAQLGGNSESNNIEYWGGNSWTNISGLNSSSSTNHLL